MPQLDFPNSPTSGAVYVAPNGITYVYDTSIGAGVWTATVTAGLAVAPGSITGTAQVGSTLTYVPGSASGGTPPYAYARQWKADGTPISGATSLTYVVVAGDAGKSITVTLTATDSSAPPVSASATTAPVVIAGVLAVTAGSIAGLAKVGSTLTYTPGVASGGVAPRTTAWIWKSGTTTVGTASSTTYVPVTGDVGAVITVVITATDAVPQTATATTAPTAAVTLPALTVTAGSIAGLAKVGSTLTYTAGVASGGIAPVAIAWIWKSGATTVGTPSSTTYVPVFGDVGAVITVVITATDSVPQTSTAATAPTAAVVTSTIPTLSYNPTPSTGPAASNTVATGTWNGTADTLSSTGCIEISINSGAYSQGPIAVANGNQVDMRWVSSGPCTGAANGTVITGTLTAVSGGTNTYSLTVSTAATGFIFTDLTAQALSTVVSSAVITIAGTNVNTFLTKTGGTLTVIEASIAGGTFAAIPASGTTMPVQPGQTIQIRGTTGAANSTGYTAILALGTATTTWTATTTAVAASITTPSITAPTNGATGLNPAVNTPAGITVTGSAYTPLNGAGATQTSSNWEVFKDGLAPTYQSVNTITAVAAVAPTPGSAAGGGFFGGQISTAGNGVADFNLIVAPVATGQNGGSSPTTIQYKTSSSADTNPPSQNEVYGKSATDLFNTATHPAFQWADGLNIGGFTDWYLPAKNELDILYFNLKPDTTANNTGSGINPNAVPARGSVYPAGGPPVQTTNTPFQTGGTEAFSTAVYYWSSSEDLSLTDNAWRQSFSTGDQSNPFKTGANYARAIRRVSVATTLAQTLTIAAANTDGFAVGQSIKGSSSAATGIITAISGTTVTVNLTSGTFTTSDKLEGNGVAITGSPFTVSAAPFLSVVVPQSALAVSSTYYTRTRYVTTNATAATSLYSGWSSFGTASSFPLSPGTALGGGYFGGQIRVFAGEEGPGVPAVDTTYNLIVAPVATGQNGGSPPTGIQYKTSNSGDTNPNSQNEVYGELATDQFDDTAHPAFQWAKGLTIATFTDWYIPAKNELEILYFNLKPDTTANNTGSGINPNAVPPRASVYGATPTQTTNTPFQTGGAEAFSTGGYYWSSSEFLSGTGGAWRQYFGTGDQGNAGKTNGHYARAIRRIAA